MPFDLPSIHLSINQSIDLSIGETVYEDPRFLEDEEENTEQQRKYALQELRIAMYDYYRDMNRSHYVSYYSINYIHMYANISKHA